MSGRAPERLRVALVTPRFAPDLGGVETHVRAVATGLAARGHEVTVLTQADGGVLATAGATDVVDGVTVRRFRLPVAGLADLPAPGLVAGLRRALRGVDLVHAHSYHALPALGAALVHGRVPLVLTPHFHGTGHTRWRARLHQVYRPVGRLLVGRADAIVAVSEAERQLLVSAFGHSVGERTRVVPNGVARPPLGRPFPCAGRVVLTVGRLEPYKRVDLLVRSLPRLPGDVRLVVVGSGPARGDLTRLAADIGVAGRVELRGRVSDAELARWRSTAAVFATVSAHEAFGIGLAESLAAGLPAVASGIPAHHEIAARAGGAALLRSPVGTVPGQAPAADAAALDEVAALLSAALTGTPPTGSRPPRHAADALWSWAQVVAATEDLYADVLRGAPSTSGRPA